MHRQSATYWNSRICDIEQIISTCQSHNKPEYIKALRYATRKLGECRAKCGVMANSIT